MENSVSDRSIYMESDREEEDDDNVLIEEEGIVNVQNNNGYDEEDDDDSSIGSRQQSRPGSYTTAWPQSYSQSIDMYSSVASPNIRFLHSTPLGRLGSSYLTSSFHKPEIISSLIKPLLPITTSITEEEQQQQQRKSSHALLPPRRPSFLKPKDERRPFKSVVSHEMHTAPHECSY